MNEVIDFKGEKYTLKKKIGKGRYGQTWLAESNGRKIAVKKIVLDPDKEWDKGKTWDKGKYLTTNRRNFRRETKLAEEINRNKCPALIKYLGTVKGPDNIRYILMEYFQGYNLTAYIGCSRKTKFVINPDQFLNMAKHLFRGLACLHNVGIAHTDIHGNNIMFNKKEMKIVDFGLLCTMPPSSKKYFSCYKDHHTEEDYDGLVELHGPVYTREEYPFQDDVQTMAYQLGHVAGNQFEIVYKKDPRTSKIIKWLYDLRSTPPKYTTQKALDILERISGTSKYLY
uniref:Putative serine/threonine protein kinase n=1 Tax=Marseillevirus LCMAC101 TaxID=2506602 RepID=A0A481YQZ1_9VIRU|nr:MAG: putative serine/threonine protein kinase [Marseillevirus LCMAC101]